MSFKLPYWTSGISKRNTQPTGPSFTWQRHVTNSGVVSQDVSIWWIFYLSESKEKTCWNQTTQFFFFFLLHSLLFYHAPPDTENKIKTCETRTWSVVSFSHSAVLSLSQSNWIQPASYSNEFALFRATDRFEALVKKTFQRSYIVLYININTYISKITKKKMS